MTILMFDGFDNYATTGTSDMRSTDAGWSLVSGSMGSFTAPTTSPRYGTSGQHCFHSSSGTGTTFILKHSIGANKTDIGFGFAWYKDSISGLTSGGKQVFIFYDSATAIQVHLDINSDGDIKAYRGSGQANLLGTSDATRRIKPGIWAYISGEIKIDDTVGTLKLWIDEVQVMNLSSLDTKATANVGADFIAWAATGVVVSGESFDDLYVTDGTQLGELRIQLLLPTADTAEKDFARSAGSNNFALIDETAGWNSDTDYTQGSTVGDYDLFDMTDLASTTVTLYGFDLLAVWRKTDATARTIRDRVKSSSAFDNSADVTLTTSYVLTRRSVPNDPNTAAAWTIANLNAAQIGYEIMS